MRIFLVGLIIFCTGCDFFSADVPQEKRVGDAATGDKTAPVIRLSKADVMLDEALAISITNLTPGEPVQLMAETRDDDGIIWQSRIKRTAGSTSSLEVTGIDPEGLFTRMAPRNTGRRALVPLFGKTNVAPLQYKIVCTTGGGSSEAPLKRHFIPEKNFVRLPVREGALVGTLFYPATGGRHPVILFLSGSTGKFNEPRAALLASKGFAVLSVAYFGIDPLPKELVEVPLEFFDRAVAFLKKQSMVDVTRMGIFGYSKGGELALLLASRHPEIKAVAAYSPSAYVWQGLARGGTVRSSWSFEGKPLPFVPMDLGASTIIKLILGKKVAFRPAYERGLVKYATEAETARIPVERIKAPVLITSGNEDAVWPADLFTKKIEASIKRAGGRITTLQDKAGGHLTTQAFLPAGQAMGSLLFGGDPGVTADVLAKAWTETVQMFKNNL